MATVRPLHPPASDDGILAALGRLARLELELGWAETRDLLLTAAIAAGGAVASVIAIIAAVVVLIAAALAPLFGAPWEHLLIAGGGVALVAAAALAWSVMRLRNFNWPRLTLESFEENWRWLGAQLRSRLTLR